MLFPNPIARLRKAHYALEDLPDAVTFPKHPARESDAPLPLEEATVDDIAFAIVAATGNMYNGLWYPIIIAGMTLVIGTLFIRETKDVDIYAND